MLPLTPSEQILIAVYALAERNQKDPADPQQIDQVKEFGPFYFGMYLLDWEGALPDLVAQGMVEVKDGCLSLTPGGVTRAAELRSVHTRQLFSYNEFYYRARHSQAHASFCERVYGKDLAQHGMADMQQLDDLARHIKANKLLKILELGCGNGTIAAYLASETGAHITGVDFSEEGIAWANELSGHHPGHLEFILGDMNGITFPEKHFDGIIIIDAAYFVADLPMFLGRILTWLRPGGGLFIFHSLWVDDNSKREQLRVNTNPLAQALGQVLPSYQATDYSAGEAEHWRLKKLAAEELKDVFEAEGNTWLYHRRWIETVCHAPYVDSGNISRYLYLAKKPG